MRYRSPSLLHFVFRHLLQGRKWGMTLVMAALYTVARIGKAGKHAPDCKQVMGEEAKDFEAFAKTHCRLWQGNKE